MLDVPNKTPQQVIVQNISEPKSLLDSTIQIPDEKEVAKSFLSKSKNDAYDKLKLSDEDRAHVHEIITILAENGKLSLLFKKSQLKQLGSQIDHLHPLKFLSAIFSNPDLKAHMRDIFEDYFKRTGFVDQLGPSLTSKAEKGELDQYIEKFAKEVNVPVEKIRPFFNNHDWEGLIEYLING